jgi:hypothetical protein
MQALIPLSAIAGMTGLFTVMDRALTRLGYQKPYYAVHVIHNAAIVAVTARDVFASVTDIHNITNYPINWTAVLMCYALHLYHLYVYWRSFHFDDWLHHGLMVAVALPMGSSVAAGALMGANLFFTTGLPGAINFTMLFAERNGWITRAIQQRVNVPVHVWLRGPGCVAVAALTAATAWSSTGSVWHRMAATLVAALTFWNGPYFSSMVMKFAFSKRDAALADANSKGPEPKDATRAHVQ